MAATRRQVDFRSESNPQFTPMHAAPKENARSGGNPVSSSTRNAAAGAAPAKAPARKPGEKGAGAASAATIARLAAPKPAALSDEAARRQEERRAKLEQFRREREAMKARNVPWVPGRTRPRDPPS